jgi:hypothetical protein
MQNIRTAEAANIASRASLFLKIDGVFGWVESMIEEERLKPEEGFFRRVIFDASRKFLGAKNVKR